jgi:hypothetical protein
MTLRSLGAVSNLSSSFFLLLLPTMFSCVCGDGGFTYNTSVRVVFEDGSPVDGARVVGGDGRECREALPETLVYSGFLLTDENGDVTVQISTGLAWGGCPPPKNAPVPDLPDRLSIFIEYPHGNVVCTSFHITEDQVTAERSGELDLDLGEIVLLDPDQSGDSDSEEDAGPGS